MNKQTLHTFFLLLTVALLCPAGMAAQDITSTFHGWSSAPLYGEDEDLYGIMRVSNNGKYAVGHDGENLYAAYYYDVENDEFVFINEYSGSGKDGKAAVVNDVSDDGMMVGAYPYYGNDANGNTVKYWQPAYRYIGSSKWVDLPLPDNAVLMYDYDMDYNSFAYRVSSDGKIVCGEMYLTDPVTEKHCFEPMLWYLDDDGNVVDTKMFYGLDYGHNTFEEYDMSDDGSVIAGKVCSARGDDLPAIIKDGELIWLAGPVLEWNGLRWAEYDENGDERENFWEGIANCIDKDGNVYYYYYDGDAKLHGVVENIETGEKTEYGKIVACGTGDIVLGLSTVVQSSKSFDLGELYTAMNISDDGRVIAGGGVAYAAWGEGFNYPALVVLSESPLPVPDSIKKMEAEGISVNRTDNGFAVAGDYNKAELINAAGQTVAVSDGSCDLTAVAGGVYIIKVTKGSQTYICKMMK